MPKVSILIPMYNAENTIERSLQSILNQTYPDWEAIVVNDGSSDGSSNLVGRFNDPRIKLLSFDRNQGRPTARQKALDEATGDYICMLDADDFYLPTKIEKQVSFLDKHPKVALVSSNICVVDNEYELKGVIRYIDSEKSEEIFPSMVVPSTLPVPHAPSMLRSSVVRDIRYDLSLNQSEDFDFLLKVLLKNSYAIINEASYVYRFDLGMTKEKILERLNLHSQIFKKYLAHYPLTVVKELLRLNVKKAVYTAVAFAGKIDQFNSRQIDRANSIEVQAYTTNVSRF